MKVLMKGVMLAVGVAGLGAMLSGCNTARGFGEDMEDAGRSIQNKTDRSSEVKTYNDGSYQYQYRYNDRP